MSDFNFKAGDKVYCPKVSNKALTLENTECSKYSVKISLESGMIRSFMIDGKHFHLDLNPSIFPATQEWYDKLVHVYPNLEKPPVKKTSKEIIQAMLDSGKKYVICWVSDCYENPDESDQLAAIQGILTYTTDRPFIDETDSSWAYATPFDTDTGKAIIDFVDGKAILESEND